jgi:radical SAM protein with 4Fe4S-binding SPASM domain
VLVTVTSISVPELKELLCFLIAKGITRINLNPFRPIGHGVDHPDWDAAPSEVDGAVRRAWDECCRGQPIPQGLANPAIHTNCGIGSFITIMPDGDVFPCHALMIPEFHCGNVRQQCLIEICRHHSLLDKLRGLDFHQLACQDKHLVPLTGLNICLGSIFARTRSLPVWRETLAPPLDIR